MNRLDFRTTLFLCGTTLALVGCTTGGVDLGGSSGNGGAGGSGGSNGDGGSTSAGLVGTWVGYIENYQFRSGSDAMTLTIDAQGNGVVRFGDQPTIPPATDPDASYPEPVDPNYGAIEYLDPYEGFDYSALDPILGNTRAQFGVAATELWDSWCPLQTSYELNATTFACLPAVTWTMDLMGAGCTILDTTTNTMVPIDCGKILLCTQPAPCICDASGCEASLAPTHHFDLVVDGDKLDGGVQGTHGSYNVHLLRTP